LVGDWVVVDRTRFSNNTMRFQALAFAPGWARLVDTWRVAREAVEILVCCRVVVGEAGRARDYDVLLGLPAPVDVVGKDGGFGRRDESGRRGDGRIVCLVLESGKAQLEEVWIEVEGRIRNHWETEDQ
jgi:hypothetical protein